MKTTPSLTGPTTTALLLATLVLLAMVLAPVQAQTQSWTIWTDKPEYNIREPVTVHIQPPVAIGAQLWIVIWTPEGSQVRGDLSPGQDSMTFSEIAVTPGRYRAELWGQVVYEPAPPPELLTDCYFEVTGGAGTLAYAKFVGIVTSEWFQTGSGRGIDVRLESVISSDDPRIGPHLVGSIIPILTYEKLVYCFVPPRIDDIHSGDRVEAYGVVENGPVLEIKCDGYLIRVNGPPPCSEGAVRVLKTCPDGSTWSHGQVCRNNAWHDEYQQCPVTPTCSDGQHWDGSHCVCPSGQQWNGQQCVTPTPQCPDGQYWTGSQCACRSGQQWNGQQCVLIQQGTGPSVGTNLIDLFVQTVSGVVSDVAANAIAESAGLQAVGSAAAAGPAGFFIPSVAGAVASYVFSQTLGKAIPDDKERCVVSSAVGATAGCVTGAALGFMAFGVGAIFGCALGASSAIGIGLSCFILPASVKVRRKSGLNLVHRILRLHVSNPSLYLYYAASFVGFWAIAILVSGAKGASLILAIISLTTFLTMIIRTAFVANLNRRIGAPFQFSMAASGRLGLLVAVVLFLTFLLAWELPTLVSLTVIPVLLVGITFCEPAILTDRLGLRTAVVRSLLMLRSKSWELAVIMGVFMIGAGFLGRVVLNFGALSWPLLGVYGALLVPLPSVAPHLLYTQQQTIGKPRVKSIQETGAKPRVLKVE